MPFDELLVASQPLQLRFMDAWIALEQAPFLHMPKSRPKLTRDGIGDSLRSAIAPGSDAIIPALCSCAADPALAAEQKAQRHYQEHLEALVASRTAELRQALGFEALLRRITERVRDSLDEQQILQTVLQELTQALDLDTCEVGAFDQESCTYTIEYEHPVRLPSVLGHQFVYRSEDAHGLRACTQMQMASYRCVIHPLAGWVTVLKCPIISDSEAGNFGLLCLIRGKTAEFSESELRLAEQVAIQCAIAIRQARLVRATQAQVEELERLNSLKDDLLNVVSHELRAPMANIKIAAEMLGVTLGNCAATHPQVSLQQPQQYLSILKAECQREIALIDDLLDLARLDAEVDPLVLTRVNLQTLVPSMVEPFLEVARQHQQQITLSIPQQLPPLVSDLSYLKRVLTELLHNACKYTPAGGQIEIAARLLRQVDGVPTLSLSVLNTGVEIPPEERDRIFEKFYRIRRNDPWGCGGTGLGLALVKKLTEQLGGGLQLESANGQTRFVLHLPQ